MSVAGITEGLGDNAPFVLLGALIGTVHFAALRLNVERYLAGGSLAPAIALHLGRLLLTGAGFALIAPSGAVQLLGALLGFTLARALTCRSGRSGS